MAEQEVIKHTKKLFSIWQDKKGFWHKVREFVVEIVIIVFAVSLSIYLHDRSVKKHQDHETKEFLLGLRQDLTTDIEEMNQDKESFSKSNKAFTYIVKRKINEPLSKDTINKYNNWIFNTTGLVPNNGRFEGFKSAGKIGNIHDKVLQNDIMDLYQEDIPNVMISTDNYTAKKLNLFAYVDLHKKRLTDTTTNQLEILASDPVFNMSNNLVFTGQIIKRYDSCIAKMRRIIAAIGREYGD